jgi:hypothetical protein
MSLALSAALFFAAAAQVDSAAVLLMFNWNDHWVTMVLLLVMDLVIKTLLWVILIFLNLYDSSID